MPVPKQYLAEIGRRGGMKSRRVLDPETARRMVQIRETRRVAKNARHTAAHRPGGIPTDTSASAQRIQDALWQRLSPAEKLEMAARLSRMVEQLAVAGLKQRHPTDDPGMIHHRRASQRLGHELASRVYGARRGDA